MKGFLQEYGIIMVVVAVVLGMLAFGKTGYAKSIQDAILGSADHIVETGENITKKVPGDVLNIEGLDYIVLEQKESDKYLVMAANSIGDKVFQSYSRSDGQRASTYEGSEIDKYLENTWYKGLSTKMQNAIKSTKIKQKTYGLSYYGDGETGPYGIVYNTINRHVFLPGMDDFNKIIDLKDYNKIFKFLNDFDIQYEGQLVNTWSRDSFYLYSDVLCLGNYNEHLENRNAAYYEKNPTHPTFVIDLSKVDYTEAGHVDYK